MLIKKFIFASISYLFNLMIIGSYEIWSQYWKFEIWLWGGEIKGQKQKCTKKEKNSHVKIMI